MVNNCINNILSIFYPPTCLLCGNKGIDGLDLCASCQQSLPRNTDHCKQCALPLDTSAGTISCAKCRTQPPIYDLLHAPYTYRFPLDDLITGFKYQQQLVNGRLLAQLLANSIIAKKVPLPEVLLPLPMHQRRLRRRGFNQASELARHLSLRLHVPWQSNLLHRSRWTEPQQGMNQRQRLVNVRNSFRLNAVAVNNLQHVALIDDVVTTGATVSAAAKALKQAGVKRVDIWTVTRTPG